MPNYLLRASDGVTPYKSGTIGTVSDTSTTVTATGITFAADDVGRLLAITSGNAKNFYRRITAFTDTSTVTVDAPFGHSPFRTRNNAITGGLDTESLPANGDSFVLSYSFDEMRDLTAGNSQPMSSILIKDTENPNRPRYYFNPANSGSNRVIFLPNENIWVHLEDADFEFSWGTELNFPNFDVRFGNGVIFGRQNLGDTTNPDIGGYPSNSCSLFVNSSNFISDGSSTRSRGVFHLNGGSFYGEGNTFIRAYDQDSPATDRAQSVRFWEVSGTGSWGARISGTHSAFVDCNFRGNTSGNFLNTTAVGIIDGMRVQDCNQVLYSYTDFAGSVTVGPVAVQDIAEQVIFTRTGGNNDSETLTILNWDFRALETLVDGSTKLIQGHTNDNDGLMFIVFDKDFNLTVTSASGNALTSPSTRALVDTDGTIVTDSDDGTGVFPTFPMRMYDGFTQGDSYVVNNFDSPDITKKFPYNYAVKHRNHLLLTGLQDGSGGLGSVDLSSPVVADANITETDTAVVDAYTDLGTPQKLYDYADKFKFDNISLPAYDRQLFTRSGTTLAATATSTDLTLDSTATDLITVGTSGSNQLITVKTPASGFVGGLTGWNNLTVDTEIQGDIEANAILHSFQDGDTVMSSGTVSGLLRFNPGTYTIAGGDISGLTINRLGIGNVTIIPGDSVTGADSVTLGTDVALQTILNVELESGDTTEGRISIFDTDSNTPFIDTDYAASYSFTSNDYTELTANNVLWVVYSGGIAKDFRRKVTLGVGSTTVSNTLAPQSYPAGDADADAFDGSVLEYDTDSDKLLVKIQQGATKPSLGDGNTNAFLHKHVRGTTEYNKLVKDRGTNVDGNNGNAIDSIGATSGAEMYGGYVEMTPNDNSNYSFGFIDNTNKPTPIVIQREVADTGDPSITYTYEITVPTSPSNFDVATTASAMGAEMRDILDDRHLTARNVGNLGQLEACLDQDGNVITPDYS